MAYVNENIHTKTFSPRDFHLELISAAKEKNLIICLDQNKEFIVHQIVIEFSQEVRNGKKVIYLTTSLYAFNLLFHLTNFRVHIVLDDQQEQQHQDQDEPPEPLTASIFTNNDIILLTIEDFLQCLDSNFLTLDDVQFLIVDECHKHYGKPAIHRLFNEFYENATFKPRILGLAGALHNARCELGRLGAELEYLERLMRSQAETASDISTVLRYCQKSSEVLLQCGVPEKNLLAEYIRTVIEEQKEFLMDHRFDPAEIYGSDEEYLEELKAIPDPKIEPLQFFDDFLFILDELGPWCADRSAFSFLIKLEKQKVKTKYERHFLLLCLVSTTIIKIRSICSTIFDQFDNRVEQVEKYSTKKVHRVLEVLRNFKPDDKIGLNGLKDHLECEDLKELPIEKFVRGIDEIGKTIECITKDFEALKVKVNDLNGGDKSPTRGLARRKKGHHPRQARHNAFQNDPDSLCGIVFCKSKLIAKALFSLFCEMSKHDPNLQFLNVQYTVDKTVDALVDPKEAENEHRKQEEVLKRFRMHECNLLIGTSVLEEGIELPKCNLVIRWDAPETYQSYVQCKGRARASKAYHVMLVGPPKELSNHTETEQDIVKHLISCNSDTEKIELYALNESISSTESSSLDPPEEEEREEGEEEEETESIEELNRPETPIKRIPCIYKDAKFPNKSLIPHPLATCTQEIVEKLAAYMEIEKMLLQKCENSEPPEGESDEADLFTSCIEPYKPNPAADAPFADLSNAIALVNKYCAKLPSDTFTKLTPLWRCSRVIRNGVTLFQYTVRLPINSPLKCDVVGVPMPSRILARRVSALVTCKALHEIGELDDSLQPIGKEGFSAFESDWENFELEEEDEKIVNENIEPRPGTTKRRQYYYKKIASAFNNCRPTVGKKVFFYFIKMILTCPIPEEQNTRGRKIYPPEESVQGFGILTMKKIPKVSAFPIFTRSGEVQVSLELVSSELILSQTQLHKINLFINYTFTKVLRLQKYLMLFDPEATENCFFIVPTLQHEETIEVDWDFLAVIEQNVNMLPTFVPDDVRKNQAFDPNRFKDAVVMPWYRNQDQPQYFYVAEICYYLTPNSSFPGDNYSTFKEYYFKKYGIEIQNPKQPLLDVDHTSARLNFLTPRYVNRKGVALPTSSEETKKAKRENLEQKQILVPELCTIHPFSASLWRAAVCLPCILYRINALLLADEIRKQVSFDLDLGHQVIIDDDFEWPMLNFGWTLADVLRKSREAKTLEASKPENDEEVEATAAQEEEEKVKEENEEEETEKTEKIEENGKEEEENPEEEKSANELLEEATSKVKSDELEIGTWSNEMAKNIRDDFEDGYDEDDDWGLPSNISMCTRKNTRIRIGSPTSWEPTGTSQSNFNQYNDTYYSDSDSFQSNDQSDYENIDEDNDFGGLKIEFKSDNVAEAIDTEEDIAKRQKHLDAVNAINNQQVKSNTTSQSVGFNCMPDIEDFIAKRVDFHAQNCSNSIEAFKRAISASEMIVAHDQNFVIDRSQKKSNKNCFVEKTTAELVPWVKLSAGERVTIKRLIELNAEYLNQIGCETHIIEGTGDIFNSFSDSINIKMVEGIKELKVYPDKGPQIQELPLVEAPPEEINETFSFDYQPNLLTSHGPSPSIILHALTMSNANDGINLERLETIGDSFLKYAITTYLYLMYENVHEGKLSHLRSKQVSNLNLYRLGRRKNLGESMIATKFEPHDNWLPPCYYVPKELEQALIAAKIPACHWNLADLPNIKQLSSEEICRLVKERAEEMGFMDTDDADGDSSDGDEGDETQQYLEDFPCFIPYNLVTQHSIPDKSIADCVEALIGAYLIECGPKGALLFMAWLGIRVLPLKESKSYINGTTDDVLKFQTLYGEWPAPKSPLITHIPNVNESLERLLNGFDQFETAIDYKFRDRSYLLQAMTHASYSPNRLTDCYQRLEFLGDAVLDYLITRYLYEDPRQHSPGALTDLRSALVNNTIFASLAVRHAFHKYFRHLSPSLSDVIDRFVRIQHENGHCISEEFYLLSEEECDEAEDVEVPKALGDVFESVAGAIFLDSNMSLDAVWRVYSKMMKPEIEQFSNSVPKSPIRELLELEPETAKFGKPEKLADGRRVRVTVEVFGKGTYRGIGRNYRIAKCTAAKCALRQLKKLGLANKKH